VPVRHAFNRHEARSGVSASARSNASLAASTAPSGNPTATKAALESCPAFSSVALDPFPINTTPRYPRGNGQTERPEAPF
jgi:hypothetical protein